jgi:hypothetical protein
MSEAIARFVRDGDSVAMSGALEPVDLVPQALDLLRQSPILRSKGLDQIKECPDGARGPRISGRGEIQVIQHRQRVSGLRVAHVRMQPAVWMGGRAQARSPSFLSRY